MRESQGGSSTLAFAYRIIARPLGSTDGRLPTLASVRNREAATQRRGNPNVPELLQLLGVHSPAAPQTTPK